MRYTSAVLQALAFARFELLNPGTTYDARQRALRAENMRRAGGRS